MASSTPTWHVENRGSFASIHVILPPRTQIHCETDAVVTFSEGVEVQGVLSGGIWGSLFRAFFGGESFFTTLVQNSNLEQPANVMLAPADPGGIELHKLTTISNNTNNDLLLTSGAYVASDVSVKISTELQSGIKNSLLSGTGFFLLRASGQGTVACAAYGSIHKFELKEGEKRSVDNGHLVAWSASMFYRVGLANARGGILPSMNSGEGLMCHFTGPGTIYLQSHKPGEAETVVKKGKSGAKVAAQTGVAIYVFVAIFSLIIGMVIVVFALGASNMQQFATDSHSAQGDYNYDEYSYGSSRSSRRQGSFHKYGFRAVGEL